MKFRGTFEHALDAKHRLTIPAKYRAVLSAGVVLAASPETVPDAPRSLSLWTAEDYDSYTTRVLAGVNPILPEARDLKRFLFNMSHDSELDSANRVMVPTHLMDYAGLSKNLIVVGSGECLEVFDRDKYLGYSQDMLRRAPDLAASLGHTA